MKLSSLVSKPLINPVNPLRRDLLEELIGGHHFLDRYDRETGLLRHLQQRVVDVGRLAGLDQIPRVPQHVPIELGILQGVHDLLDLHQELSGVRLE